MSKKKKIRKKYNIDRLREREREFDYDYYIFAVHS
jgi:hypothetical protein